MTPAQINAAIAGWMGWTDISPTFHVGFDPDTGQPRPIPNFHGDLNACHEAEHKLYNEQVQSFEVHLNAAIARGCRVCDFALYPSDKLWHATASQRCEALLRTTNLWKE